MERRRSRLSFSLPLSPPLSETRSPVESSIAGPSVRTPAGEGAGGKGWSWMQGVLALAETEGAPRRRCYFGAASPPSLLLPLFLLRLLLFESGSLRCTTPSLLRATSLPGLESRREGSREGFSSQTRAAVENCGNPVRRSSVTVAFIIIVIVMVVPVVVATISLASWGLFQSVTYHGSTDRPEQFGAENAPTTNCRILSSLAT